jgi:hypothetical protein
MYVVVMLVVVLLPGLGRAQEPQGNSTLPFTLWLPVVGHEQARRITHYGYGYGPDRDGQYSHNLVVHTYPFTPYLWEGPRAQFEIYDNKDASVPIGEGEMYPQFLAASTLRYHWEPESNWPPPDGLEQGKMYYLRVRAHWDDYSTPWTPLGEFEAFHNGQLFQP